MNSFLIPYFVTAQVHKTKIQETTVKYKIDYESLVTLMDYANDLV